MAYGESEPLLQEYLLFANVFLFIILYADLFYLYFIWNVIVYIFLEDLFPLHSPGLYQSPLSL